jgi:hypothetical protein
MVQAAAESPLDGVAFVLRRREFILGALVTAAVAGLLLALGPAPGDAPAHLYRTLLVRHGDFVWDNFWYAGDYPLASYSLLFYVPAAVVGNLPLVFAAAVTSTVLFASIAYHEWGSSARWASRVFGVLAAAPLFTGLYSYSLGFATALAVLRALQTRHTWIAITLSALTLGFSPLAFAFLCLVLLAVVVSRRRVTRRFLLLGLALVSIAGVEAFVLIAFPSPGVYPFHLVDLVGVLGVSALGALLARQARGGGPLLAFYALWAAGSVVAFTVPTPLGGNWTRLSEFVFPLMLLTASLAGFRPRRLAILALAAAFAYNVTPYLLLIPYRLDSRPATARFWQPAIDFLRDHEGPNYRVEVVPTAAHWESYWIPRAGFALARGWYRQLDLADNPVLYSKHLNGVEYQSWLRSNAVDYVLLPSTQLDPVAAPQEARLLHSGSAGLSVAFRSKNWTIYRLPHATPLITGPAKAHVVRFGHTSIAGIASMPGRYLLRTHYTPYWSVRGAACVRPTPGDMTWLDVSAAGPFSLTLTSIPDALLDASAANHDGAC